MPTQLELFLRMPVIPRLKTEDSLIQKAFYRLKNYTDPYAGIEDKVGLRFVVLLSEDIKTIEDAILHNPQFWSAQKARDFQEERAERPFVFDYQSVHYITYSKLGNRYGETAIPEGIPCEIQIRTLMQHAYSELTHDTIYKPTVAATPEMKRAVAKSMALIEATDDYFSQVANVLSKATASYRKIAAVVAEQHEAITGLSSSLSPLNSLLIDHYKDIAPENFISDLQPFLDNKQFISNRVKVRSMESTLYRVPAILLVYFCVAHSPAMAKHNSPLSDDELEIIYADLGMGLN